jgi:iron complex transport system permease protein
MAVDMKRQTLLSLGLIPGLLVVLILGMIFSFWLGRYPVSPGEIVKVVFTTPLGDVHDPDDIPWTVIMMVRLPRILLATLAGMGLALAGAAMQGVFRNPLVGPEVVGASAGASFGGVLAIILGFSSLSGVVFLAFIFGAGALVAAFAVSRPAGQSGLLGLILAGVIISAFFSALTGIATYLADPASKLPNIIYWLMGSFAAATYPQLAMIAGVTLLAGTALLGLSWRINLLSLGQSDAEALGINIQALRWGVLACVSLIVAAQVAVSGGVGWVGLVIPHLARMVVGPEHSRLLPVSALLGGLYLLTMDNLARGLTPQEIPIGLLTAIVGTPVFLVLFLKMQSRGWNND